MDAAVKALQSQHRELLLDPPPGVNAGPADDDMFCWAACIQGPVDTPYEKGLFFLSMQFPSTYPFDPPRVTFDTPIFHPNINEAGEICLSILFKDCTWDNGWSPALTVSSVLLSLVVLLQEPNTEHSLRPELALLHDQDRKEFDRVAREHTAKHAM